MCEKPILKDGVHSWLGDEGADARFCANLTNSQQDTRYDVFFLLNRGRRLNVICFSNLFHHCTSFRVVISSSTHCPNLHLTI